MSSHGGLFSAVPCLWSTPDLADSADDGRGWPADITHRVQSSYQKLAVVPQNSTEWEGKKHETEIYILIVSQRSLIAGYGFLALGFYLLNDNSVVYLTD